MNEDDLHMELIHFGFTFPNDISQMHFNLIQEGMTKTASEASAEGYAAVHIFLDLGQNGEVIGICEGVLGDGNRITAKLHHAVTSWLDKHSKIEAVFCNATAMSELPEKTLNKVIDTIGELDGDTFEEN